MPTQQQLISNLMQQIQDLRDDMDYIMNKRIGQVDVIPNAIKQRHIAEGVKFVRSGLAADRPTNGEDTALGSAIYFATDTYVLSVWTGTAWKSTTLS